MHVKKILLIGIICIYCLIARTQTISCDELYNFIVENGYKKTTIHRYVMNSSWLNKVTAYSYNYKLYVVAEIKKNDFDFNPKSYIFCLIPSQNWFNFQYGAYRDSDSYGERFHKYIMDYKCNCN